jgi:hypothetical protein
MKIIPLILILITGCVNWAPDEYHNIPPDRIIDSVPYELEENENVKLAQRANELCMINPIGTFSCARY